MRLLKKNDTAVCVVGGTVDLVAESHIYFAYSADVYAA